MRVLYVARLFSGLESSVLNGRWEPTGVPTIFKIVETLARQPNELRLVLAAKDGLSAWPDERDAVLALEGLDAPVTVLAGAGRFPRWFGRFRRHFSELRQLWHIWRVAAAMKPDLIYVDHANFLSAGVLARLRSGKVVFRVMGVYPAMRDALTGSRLAHRVQRWCYSAPFGAVICTQDGSGGEIWLDRALAPSVPRVLLVNGVDLESEPTAASEGPVLPTDRTVVLFVGRIDWHKGAEEFVAGFVVAWRLAPEQLHAVVIGTGRLASRLRERVAEAGARSAVSFVDRMPHRHILSVQRQADIYVSLNRYGNLSTANLEAMRCGKAMIIPAAQPSTGVDAATEALIPADAAVRITDISDADALGEAILRLHEDRDQRTALAAAMAAAAARFVSDWPTRIATEMRLLRALACGKRQVVSELTDGAGMDTTGHIRLSSVRFDQRTPLG
jgi:glycosyltransferase involved in cell wall biosynthesis